MEFKFKPKVANALLILGALVLLASPAKAGLPAQFKLAFDQFMQARAGNDSAIDKSAEAFAALLKMEPGNPVLMAYTGACTTMKATTTWLPWKKINYAEDGLALLDKALAMLTSAHNAAPENDVPAVLEVRFVASNTFLALPGFLNRHARGARLLQEVLNSPLLAASPLAFQAEVWLAGADLAAKEKRLDDARKYLNLVIERKTPQMEAARTKLKALAS